MPLTVTPISPSFAANVDGIDLREPLAASEIEALRVAQGQYGVLVFQRQNLTGSELEAFAAQLGPLQRMGAAGSQNAFVLRITNLDENGVILPVDDRRRAREVANQLWHTDSSYLDVRASLSMLVAHIVPGNGADTEFADMRAAYDELPKHTQMRISKMRARHSILHSRSLTGFTAWTDEEKAFFRLSEPRPLVHVHRQSGRRCLYLASHIQDIDGLTFEESQAQVSQLIEFATQRRFVYRHRWQVGDLVIWDNLATMHRARPYDDLQARRELKSVRVLETAESAPRDVN